MAIQKIGAQPSFTGPPVKGGIKRPPPPLSNLDPHGWPIRRKNIVTDAGSGFIARLKAKLLPEEGD